MTAVRTRSPQRRAVAAAELRRAIGQFATGVTVVTSLDADGEPTGTTASAVSALSLDPPLVLVCLARTSRTLDAVCERGAFAINVLGADQRALSANFARRGSAASWADVAYRPGPAGIPWLDGVLAVLDCVVDDRLPGGDHEIVVGRVREAQTPGEPRPPLLHHRGAYAELGRS